MSFSAAPSRTSMTPLPTCCGRMRICTGNLPDALPDAARGSVDLLPCHGAIRWHDRCSRPRCSGSFSCAAADDFRRRRPLYATVVEKAAALGFSIIQNHPFVDGNKRAGHASMEVFLILNGLEIGANTETQASVILSVAAGQTNRQAFTAWLEQNVITRES